MNKGGYKIVNFNGSALSGTPTSISGIYNQIVDDYDKAVLVSGVSLNGALKDDTFASAQEKVAGDSSKYVEITAYGGVITVTEDDEVSFAAASTPEELAEKIGDLDDLETTDKDSIVDAINEVNGKTGVTINYTNINVTGDGTTSVTKSTGINGQILGVIGMTPQGNTDPYTKLTDWSINETNNTISCTWSTAILNTASINFRIAYI